jgi:hypothetical protein
VCRVIAKAKPEAIRETFTRYLFRIPYLVWPYALGKVELVKIVSAWQNLAPTKVLTFDYE